MNADAAHGLWAASYDEMPNPLLALEQRLVLPLLPDLRGRVAVDVACGTGRWARELRHRGASVVAIDRCADMVARAATDRCVGDAANLPIPDNFADLTICAFGLSYTGPCLRELERVTREGGAVIVSDMHPAAVRAGWTRSFRSGRRRIIIESQPYTLDSLHCPGLRLAELVEARIGEPELEIFVRAGRADLLARACAVNAVFAAMWIRDVH